MPHCCQPSNAGSYHNNRVGGEIIAAVMSAVTWYTAASNVTAASFEPG
jgi:hypothetical protein